MSTLATIHTYLTMVLVLERWRRRKRKWEGGKEERLLSILLTHNKLRKGEWLPQSSDPLLHHSGCWGCWACCLLSFPPYPPLHTTRWVFVSSSSPSDPNTTHILSLFDSHTFTHFASSLPFTIMIRRKAGLFLSLFRSKVVVLFSETDFYLTYTFSLSQFFFLLLFLWERVVFHFRSCPHFIHHLFKINGVFFATFHLSAIFLPLSLAINFSLLSVSRRTAVSSNE